MVTATVKGLRNIFGLSCGWLTAKLVRALAFMAVLMTPALSTAVIIDSGPVNIGVPNDPMGIYLNVVTGFTGLTASFPGWDFNPYNEGGNLAFFTSTTPAHNNQIIGFAGLVQPLFVGALIGPNSGYLAQGTVFTDATGFRVTGTNYVGFRFTNEATGAINYGYAELATTSSTGFPAIIKRYVYENTGLPITVAPTPSGIGTLTTSDPTFNRPSGVFGQGGACVVGQAGYLYRTHTFTLAATQNVVISAVTTDGATFSPASADTFMVLYGPGGFNPATPCANAIAADDDGGENRKSRISTTTPLAPGTYTVVLTSFSVTPSGAAGLPWNYKLTASAELATPVVTGTLSLSDPTYDGPTNEFLQGEVCTLVDSKIRHYRTHAFSLAAAQNVVITTRPVDGALQSPASPDTLITLYGPGGFNPATPCANAIAMNDDADGIVSRQSRIETTSPLAAGIYTLVMTSFDSVPGAPNALPWNYTIASNVVLQPAALTARASNDLNGDGKSDLLLRNSSTGQIAGYLMNGISITSAAGLIGPGGWTATHTGDLDGDGKADILWRNNDGTIAAWLMNGLTPKADAILTPGAGWSITHVADLNGDGKADILWQHTDGRVAGWTMNGTTATGGAIFMAPGAGWRITHMADLNGDGKADILWQHTDGRIAAWLMNGLTPTLGSILLGGGTGFSITHTADLNGDGKADILWQNGAGVVTTWLMDGVNQLGSATLQNAGAGWSITHMADLNGDGKADILWQHTDGRVAAWTMNGTTPIGGTVLMGPGTGWSITQMADFNGDGKADIVWKQNDGRIAIWQMDAFAVTGAGVIFGPGANQVLPGP